MARETKNVVEVGQRFGKLVVVDGEYGLKARYRAALCKCDCGNDHVVRINLLLNGGTNSCGCNRGQHDRKKPTTPPVKRHLVGQKFGRLLVRSDSGQRNYKRGILWDCICDCGTEKLVETSQLTCGITSSCGCLQREIVAERQFVDHTGKRFGMLTVLELHSRGEDVYARWSCKCDCGGSTVVRSNALTQREIVSCGCAAKLGRRVRDDDVVDRAIAKAQKRRTRISGAGGKFTPAQIAELLKKQRGKCAWCHVKLTDENMARDHRQSVADGGSSDILNIELLCRPCNSKKHAKDPIRWANENGKLC